MTAATTKMHWGSAIYSNGTTGCGCGTRQWGCLRQYYLAFPLRALCLCKKSRQTAVTRMARITPYTVLRYAYTHLPMWWEGDPLDCLRVRPSKRNNAPHHHHTSTTTPSNNTNNTKTRKHGEVRRRHLRCAVSFYFVFVFTNLTSTPLFEQIQRKWGGFNLPTCFSTWAGLLFPPPAPSPSALTTTTTHHHLPPPKMSKHARFRGRFSSTTTYPPYRKRGPSRIVGTRSLSSGYCFYHAVCCLRQYLQPEEGLAHQSSPPLWCSVVFHISSSCSLCVPT